MRYDDAKRTQIEEFKRGRYLVLREREDQEGEYYLITAASRQVAEESITRDALAEVKRFPPRFRLFTGGKL